MTESEWLEATDPEPMVEFVREKTSDRKLRLLACACVSSLLPLAKLVPDQLRTALGEVELYADGATTKAAMKRVRERMEKARALTPSHRTTADDFVCYAVEYSARDKGHLQAVGYSARLWGWGCSVYEPLPHASIVRDIFGNPFHPVTVYPSWLTPDVLALATGIYAGRAFDRLPILADALQDAGVDSDELLSHLRSDGPHCKGCWALDLVLGKS